MTLIEGLCLMLFGAHLFGWVAERLRQPALVGHMLAGIVLGPSVLNWMQAGPTFAAISDLAVLFVVVAAGLEMRMQHVLDVFRGKSSFALLVGFAIPTATAGAFAWLMGMALIPGLVVTLCLSVTALPVALRILSSFGMLDTSIARVAIASALMSDVIVLVALGVAVSLVTPSSGSWLPVAGISMTKLVALLALVGICHFACLRLSALRAARNINSKYSDNVLIATLLFTFAFGALSELLGFHFVIGAFFAALMITRDLISDAHLEKLERTCEVVTISLFGPLFLAYQGIQFQLGTLDNASLVVGLVLVAIASKLLGGYVMARLKKLPHQDALAVGAIMNARGVMEMVVASIAYHAGLVDQGLYSALLLVGMVTTVITPLLLRQWLTKSQTAQLAFRQ
jgi:Kef-type K+ transport system membrane component KefB